MDRNNDNDDEDDREEYHDTSHSDISSHSDIHLFILLREQRLAYSFVIT